MALRSRTAASPTKDRTPADELAAAIGAAACAVCGATVFPGQGTRRNESWADRRRYEPGWAVHDGVCRRIGYTLSSSPGRPALDRCYLALAALVDPSRPRVDDAVIQVAREVGTPVLFGDVGTPHDRGHREPWGHIPRAERRKLVEAVTARRAELAEAASRWPCALCGVWPVPEGSSAPFQGGRTCPDCSRAVTSARKKVGGLTSNLDTYGMATATLPEGAMFAEEVVPAVRHGSWAPMQAPRAPWGHLRHQPIPKTAEERLAELEARLVGAAPQG